MEAVIGLVGVASGALLAPALDWARQSQRLRQERRRELLDATAEFVAASGDMLSAEWATSSGRDAWKTGTGFRANAARWRLALLAPDAVADAAHVFAKATETQGKRIQAVGGWDGAQIAAEYDAWKQAEHKLSRAARAHLGET
jgi:hypothetical protein